MMTKIERAIKLARNGDKATASRILLQVIEAEPDNELVWYWLAWCSIKKSDRLYALKRVLEINPGNARARAEWKKLTSNVSRRKKRRETRGRRKQPKSSPSRMKLSGVSGLSRLGKVWGWVKNLVFAIVHASKEFVPKGLFGTPSNSYASSSSNRFPSGYLRSDYHNYGYSDEDIEMWGLDQPGSSSDRLPNGYLRSDYHSYGYSDEDIEMLGLDQPGAPSNSYASSSSNRLPNGHLRSDYHSYGYSDEDIEMLGLDQSGAPSPQAAGWVIAEMIEDMGW